MLHLTKTQKRTLQGAGLVIGANLLSRALTQVVIGDKNQNTEIRKNYQRLEKPVWKIPTWLFGPAWSAINLCQAYGTTNLLKAPKSPERNKALALHTLAWALFVSWSPASSALKSQKRSALLTFATAAAAFGCVLFGSRVNRKIGLSYVPMTLWGAYASAQSVWMTKHNSKIIHT